MCGSPFDSTASRQERGGRGARSVLHLHDRAIPVEQARLDGGFQCFGSAHGAISFRRIGLQSAARRRCRKARTRSKHVKIGVPKEIKTLEYRVGLTPAGARELVRHGHQVVIEHDAGAGIGCGDDSYREAGAAVTATAPEVFASSDLIVKVKEPQPNEIALLRPDQILFTYLHLAADS